METKTLIEGIAVGAVAGAIAGLLLGSKAGQEARDEIQAELVEIKDRIIERLQTLEDFTQAKYDGVVKAVLAEYVAAKKIPAEQAQELEARLRDGYETIRKTVCEHACSSKATAKRATKSAAKPAKHTA